MKKKTIILILSMIVILVVAFVLYNNLKAKTPATEQPTKLTKAPNFTVVDQNGNQANLNDFIGKPIVLNFFASWCQPCRSEMPHFNEVYLEKKDDITFLMIDAVDGYQETKAKGEKYIKDNGFSFPVFFDIDQQAVIAYKITGFPTTYFINKDGYIVAGASSAIDKSTLLEGISLIED